MEEAFGKMEDPNQALLEAIGQIKSEERTQESISTALEVIDRLCDDPDVARNVEKLDGLQPLLDMVRDFEGPIRFRGLEILALLFSNNPKIQEAGIKREALALFMAQVKDSGRGTEQRSKAFRAMVALVRALEPFEDLFLRKQGGLALLVDLLDPAEDPRTREKAAAFTLSMACNGSLKAEEVKDLAPKLAAMVADGESAVQYREVTANCAAELSRLDADACRPVLLEPVQARHTSCGAEDEVEKGALQDCLDTLAKA